MALKLVDRIRLAREELDGQTTDSTNNVDGTIDVVEAIQQENDAVEITELQNEVESDAAAMEELEEVQGDLEEQAQEDEEIIEGVEENVIDETEVKPENVQASQEALRIAMKRLGENVRGSNFLSHEEISNNPYRALKMSHEGIKEWIDKIIEGIKSLYRKIVDFIKKIWVKIKAFFGNLEAKLENLENILKAKEDKGLDKVNNLNADKEKAIAAAFGPVLNAVIGGDVNGLISCKILDFKSIAAKVKNAVQDSNALMVTGINKSNVSDSEIEKDLKEIAKGYEATRAEFKSYTDAFSSVVEGANDGLISGSKSSVKVLRCETKLDFTKIDTKKDESVAEVKEAINKFAKSVKVEPINIVLFPKTDLYKKVTVSTLLKVVKSLKESVKDKKALDEALKAHETSLANLDKVNIKVKEEDGLGVKIAVEVFKARSKVNKDSTLFMNTIVTDTFNNLRSAIAGVAKLTSYVSEEKEDRE